MASLTSARVVSDMREFFKNAEAKKAKCSLCSKELVFHGGTTNLHDHLLKVHPLHYKKKTKTSVRAKQGALNSLFFLRPRQCSGACFQELTGCRMKASKVKFQPSLQP